MWAYNEKGYMTENAWYQWAFTDQVLITVIIQLVTTKPYHMSMLIDIVAVHI